MVLIAADVVDEPVFLETVRVEVAPVDVAPAGVVAPEVGPAQAVGEVVGVHVVVQVEVTLVVVGGTVVQRTAEDVHRLGGVHGETRGGFVHLVELGRAGSQGEECKDRYDKLFHIHCLPLD